MKTMSIYLGDDYEKISWRARGVVSYGVRV